MDLTGKWKYCENYGYGIAEGELYLRHQGERLSGRIVFTDRLNDRTTYMIQEFLEGKLDGKKVHLNAHEFDIIHSEFSVSYELDSWFGILVDDSTIKGVSVDDQGIEGNFEFVKIEAHLPKQF